MSTLKEYAIWYAQFGWPIFPCYSRQKVPATAHGVKDATTDLAQIDKWWATNLNYNIALACGGISNLYVVDVDFDSEKGINGYESLKEFPSLPQTVMQRTPRGGYHAFYTAKNPPANKNSFRPGIDIRGDGYYVILAPSIHPNGKSYGWVPGYAPWDHGLSEFPDFMQPELKPELSQPLLASPITSVINCDNRLRRASRYLGKCDPAIQGQAGHDKLLWAAQCMVYGFLLSDEEAFNILALEYNPRCDPPWNMSIERDHKDFCRKIREARKNPSRYHPKGWLLAANEESEYEEASPQLKASIKSLLKATYKTSTPAMVKRIPFARIRPTREEYDFVVNPFGFLGKFCSWVNANSIRSQPILTLGGSLAFFGTLFGRKVKDRTGIRTNVYCMGIGKSSAGKQHVQDCARNVIDTVGCHRLLGGTEFASDVSIEVVLEKNPAVIFLMDEIGHIFMQLKSKPSACTEKIIPVLMRIWSSAKNSFTGRSYANEDKIRHIIQPCLCIYGTSTPDRFIEGMSTAELNDGWLSRCMVFITANKPLKNRKYTEPIPPIEICDFVNAWAFREIKPKESDTVRAWQRHAGEEVEKTPPSQILLPATDEAEKIFENFDLSSREIGEESPIVECLWDKFEENARKLALILATSVNYDNPIIDGACADYGCKLASYLLRDFGANMIDQISSTPHEEKKNKIWNVIKRKGSLGCGRKTLARDSGWSSKRERDDAISDLHEAGRIVTKFLENEETYWAAEYYPG